MASPCVEWHDGSPQASTAQSAAPTTRSNTSPYKSRSSSKTGRNEAVVDSPCYAAVRVARGMPAEIPHPYHYISRLTTAVTPTMVPHEIYTVLCQRWGVQPNSRLLKWLAEEVSIGLLTEGAANEGQASMFPANGHLFQAGTIRAVEGLVLDFTTNYLGPKGLRPVLSLLAHLPYVRSLVLKGNQLQHSCVAGLVAALDGGAAPWLQAIDLSDNPSLTTQSGSLLLVFASRNAHVTELCLYGTGLSKGQLAAIGRVIQRNREMSETERWERGVQLRQSSGAADRLCYPSLAVAKGSAVEDSPIALKPIAVAERLPAPRILGGGIAELFAAAGLTTAITSPNQISPPPLKVLRLAAESPETVEMLRAGRRRSPPLLPRLSLGGTAVGIPPPALQYPALGLLYAALSN